MNSSTCCLNGKRVFHALFKLALRFSSAYHQTSGADGMIAKAKLNAALTVIRDKLIRLQEVVGCPAGGYGKAG